MEKMKSEQKIWSENLKGSKHLENFSIDDRISKGILGKWWETVDWSHLSQDRDQWWALGNMVMNLSVP
jgi:hypothetical protein